MPESKIPRKHNYVAFVCNKQHQEDIDRMNVAENLSAKEFLFKDLLSNLIVFAKETRLNGKFVIELDFDVNALKTGTTEEIKFVPYVYPEGSSIATTEFKLLTDDMNNSVKLPVENFINECEH